jgi:hypothetical protein
MEIGPVVATRMVQRGRSLARDKVADTFTSLAVLTVAATRLCKLARGTVARQLGA